MCSKKWIGIMFLLLTVTTVQAQTCYPASIPASTLDSQLQDNGDGTISDSKTGLMWKECSEGQSDADCGTNSIMRFSWTQALQHVQAVNNNGGFAGHNDWRIPTIKELNALVEQQCFEPSINLHYFPNTSSGDLYFSSSPIAGSTEYVWVVAFDTGRTEEGYKYHYAIPGALRLVRDNNSMLVGWTLNPNTGHHYKRVSCGTWKECESKAVAEGAHLVTINSAEENTWLIQTFGSDYLWIGFTDENSEGNWRWVSGEAVTYTNWADAEPNNFNIENHSHFTDGGKWNDLDGNRTDFTTDAIWEKIKN